MKRYFKICLWSPLWLPVLLWCALALAELLDVKWQSMGLLIDGVADVLFVLMWSLILGGVQYLITLVLTWRRIDFEDHISWIKACLVLPLIFTPIQVLLVAVIFLFKLNSSDAWLSLGALALFDLAVGYAYVFLWLIGFVPIYLIRRQGKKGLNYGG